jgi:methionyl-tRNA synthetase
VTKKKKFYVTTAIPYVNAAPHIGFSLEIVQTDTLARYHRLLGDDVFFLTGADENSLKNVQAAEKEQIPVQALCDKYAAKYKDLKKALNLSFDDFIRTSDKKRHWLGAQKLWQACDRTGDIYQKDYEGLYCVGCEEFKTEKEVIGDYCPEHPDKKLERVKEKNYFFKLSKYQKRLEKLISSGELKVVPETRKNEVLSFIRSGLEDFSISRSVKRAKNWGIPVPGDSKQIIYVWFDALANYITALGYGTGGRFFNQYWPADVHVIGKGIIRFHAVYWPAMLISAGIELPRSIFVHGYVTVEGKKISKSLGNVIDPFALVKKYGADPIRYYLLKEISPYQDGDFSLVRFKEVYNADLANGLGNLVQRVARLCEIKNYSGKHSSHKKIPSQFTSEGVGGFTYHMENFEFNLALEEIWREIKDVDILIDKEKVWKLSDKDVKNHLERAIESILDIAYLLKPFLPKTAEKIEKIFTSERIKAPQKPLFPRLR